MIVGEDPVYLSHLGVLWFHPELHPHNFQVIVEAGFEDGEDDPQQAYVEDRQKHGEQRLYTLQPAEAFVITDLIPTGPEPPPLRLIKGHIIRGHFERFPTEEAFREARVATDVLVDIKHVVYFREFDPEGAKLPQLEYVLFGRGSDLFLAHLISSPPPDFDQLLRVEIDSHAFSDDQLSQGLGVTFTVRANSVDARFRAGEQVLCEFPAADTEPLVPVALKLEAGEEIYCEEGELESTVGRDAVGRPVFPPFRTCRP